MQLCTHNRNESAAGEKTTPRLQHPKEHATNCAVALHLHSPKKRRVTCETRRKIKIRCPLADITWCESVNENENFFFAWSISLEVAKKRREMKIDHKKSLSKITSCAFFPLDL